jgi:predicted nucleic-acid-binding protein
MKITADTNVLVRAAVMDDPGQAAAARKVLQEATLIAVSPACLCEFVWVLKRVYRFDSESIAGAIQSLLNTENIAMNRPATEAGLAILEAGGDFADGIIAHTGAQSGGDCFVSFDQNAIKLVTRQGGKARLLT